MLILIYGEGLPPPPSLVNKNSPSPDSTAVSIIVMDNTSNRRRPSQAEADGDPALWAAFTDNFRQVQSVLDRNRSLIQQVNENHQSKLHENMVKNVSLIHEINGNISKVVSLYSDLSSNFITVVNHAGDSKTNADKR